MFGGFFLKIKILRDSHGVLHVNTRFDNRAVNVVQILKLFVVARTD